MNIISDLLIGGLIFLIIILFRSTIRNHRGGITGGLLILLAGYFISSLNLLYGEIIFTGGLILIMIGLAERHEDKEEIE